MQLSESVGVTGICLVIYLDVSDEDDGCIFDEHMVLILLEEFAQFGETILVRFVGDKMWITFRDGQAVLEAMKKTNGTLRVRFLLSSFAFFYLSFI